MVAVPSIVLIGLIAVLSLVSADVLSRPWHRYVALTCAGVEIVTVVLLVLLIAGVF